MSGPAAEKSRFDTRPVAAAQCEFPRLPEGGAFVPPGSVRVATRASHVGGASWVLVYGGMAAAFVPILVLVGVLSGPRLMYVAAPGVLLLMAGAAWAWWLVVKRARLDEAALADGFEYERGLAARVRIACRPWWGARLVRERDLREAFEPEIARVPLAIGVAGGRVLSTLGGMAGAAAALALWRIAKSTPMTAANIWVMMGATAAGAVGLQEFCAPTYVRIIPGRLEVLRFSLFRRRPASLASFDLRRSRVLVHVQGAVVLVEEPGDHGPPKKVRSKKWPYAVTEEPAGRAEFVCFVLAPARRRLLETVCVAALTSALTPEVPPDEMLG